MTFIKGHKINVGRKYSEESKKRMSIAQLKCGNKPPGFRGKKHSDDAKRKMSEKRKGVKQSLETIRKRVESRKGYKHSEETKKKMSESKIGHSVSNETRDKISQIRKENPTRYWLGKKRPSRTDDEKIKISEKLKGRKHPIEVCIKRGNSQRGEKSHFWKGGISSVNHIIRQSLESRIWRKKVFERDNFTCVFCGKRGGRLNADHIKRFSDFPELRFDINNGRTLCEPCHRKTPTWGWPKKINYETK